MAEKGPSSTAVVEPEGGCLIGGPNLIICRPRYFAYHTFQKCPTCKTRRRFVGLWEMWYGDTIYCLTCNDGWQDGYWKMPRGRTKDEREGRKRYVLDLSANALTAPVFKASRRAYLADYFRDEETVEKGSS